MNAPRSLDFFIFRVCERFGWDLSRFQEKSYAEQMQYLAYELLRQHDEQRASTVGLPSTTF